MSTIAELLVGLGIDSDAYDKGINAAGDHADSFVSKITGTLGPAVAGAFVAGGAAVTAFAATSVSKFATFQASMNEVFTLLPGISSDAMGKMTQQVKDFSTEFGVLPDDVVPALYQSLSAGVPADNVFAFLESANKAATAGVTDLSVAVDGISSVVNAYGSDVVDATKASDLMFTAVKLGKTNFEQLSQSLFNVTPTAAAAGVKFEDITASLAAMTLQGVPTSVATTQLRSALVELSKDGTKTSDLFEKLAGKTFKDFISSGGDLQGALQLLETHAKDSNVGINDLFSSVEAGNAALALTGKGTEAFNTAIDGMRNSAGATQTAFDTMNSGIADSVDDIKAAFAVFMLDVGERLAPLVSAFADVVGTNLPIITSTFLAFFDQVVAGAHNLLIVFQDGGFEAIFTVFEDGSSSFASFLQIFGVGEETALAVSSALHQVYTTVQPLFPLISQLGNLIGSNWQPILVGIAGVLAVVVVGAIASFVASIATVAAPIIAAIAIGAALYKAYQENFLGVQTVVTTVVNAVSKVIQVVMSVVLAFWQKNGADIISTTQASFKQIEEIISGVLSAISTIVSGVATFISNLWQRHGDTIVGILTGAWNLIKGVFKGALDIIQGLVTAFTGLITGDWQKFADGCAQVVTGMWEVIKTAFEAAFGIISGLVSAGFANIKRDFDNFVSTAISLGRNILDGIISGVEAGVGALIDAVSDAAQSALDAAKDMLGIHSPSTEFRSIGINIMQSAASGVLDTANALTDALNGIFDDAIASAQSAIGQIKDIASSGFHLDMSGKTIEDIFKGGSGGSGFKFPSFASGVQNFAGGFAMVGERGRELVELPRGSNVYPSGAMGIASPGAGGVTQQFQIDAHYKTVQDEMTLRDRIRLESLLNAPAVG